MVIVRTKNGKPVFSKYIKGKMRISILFLLEHLVSTGQENRTIYVEPNKLQEWLKNEESNI